MSIVKFESGFSNWYNPIVSMSRLENARAKMGYYLAPVNQDAIKRLAENYRRLSGNTQSKGYKAELRRAQDNKFARDWIYKQSELNLDPKQRFDLALKRGNDADVEFIFDHLDDLGRYGFRIDVFIKPASTDNNKIA